LRKRNELVPSVEHSQETGLEKVGLMENGLLETNLEGIALHRRGKVRDVYEVGEDLLIVATDRISAFDVVMPTGIPDKGKVLTQLSLYWFAATRHIVTNHVLTSDVADYPPSLAPYRGVLESRSMLVRKTEPVPFECVVRGYLYGSGWEDYKNTGSVCGIALPPGLTQAERFPSPLFTPATKAESGHDINVSEKVMAGELGLELSERLKTISLELYRYGSAEAEAKGIIIADTKFEFGLDGDELVLIDEVLTPDSSRFWPADQYEPGRSQPSYDKQFVRDYLSRLDWDKTPPGPALPDEVVSGTRDRYQQAFRTLAMRDRF
jgi:phosphoribosylaminoimidazole-succinocarboxamide synthase